MTHGTYLVASDFSPHSRRAARVAFGLAKKTRARVELFCALSRRMIERHGADPERVRRLLEALAESDGDAAVESACSVAVADDAAGAILRRARASKASLVVVAPHGASGWRRILLGSVAQKVVRRAATSVLVARSAAEAARGPVLAGVAMDGSTRPVLRHAIALARSLRAELDVCHVVQPLDILLPVLSPAASAEPPIAALGEQLARRLAATPHRGVRASSRVLVGSAAETLVGEARRRDARFVVVGATSKSKLRGVLLGDVAHAVAAASDRSVLIVRGDGARA